MADDIKTQDAGTADKVKLAVAILIVAAGVAGYYVLANQAAWMRWLAVVASLVLAAIVVAIAGFFFWVLDLALAWLTKTLTGTGG